MYSNFSTTFAVALNHAVFNIFNGLCQVLIMEIVQNSDALRIIVIK